VHQSGDEFSLPRADGGRPRAIIPRRSCRGVDFSPRRRMGRDPPPIRCRTRDRISPPGGSIPRRNAPVNPTQITVRLQAGFPPRRSQEPPSSGQNRKARTAPRASSGSRQAKLPADRDFRADLETRGRSGAVGRACFRELVGDNRTICWPSSPPRPSIDQAEQKPLPREVIFVIDNSGSMGGTLDRGRPRRALLYAPGAGWRPGRTASKT